MGKSDTPDARPDTQLIGGWLIHWPSRTAWMRHPSQPLVLRSGIDGTRGLVRLDRAPAWARAAPYPATWDALESLPALDYFGGHLWRIP